MDVVTTIGDGGVGAGSRKGLSAEALEQSIREWLTYAVGKDASAATRRDWFHATSLAVRDRIVDRWMDTTRATYAEDAKRVYYFSLEFLIGRLLHSALVNLGLTEALRTALDDVGQDLFAIADAEPDAALGNGGLGRLAACFLDSMASLGLPGYGYGIRYEFGLFEQRFDNGWQVERPEQWLKFGNPWEFPRPEVLYPIQFGGRVDEWWDGAGRRRHRWVEADRVLAMAYDTPVVGFGGKTINTLRLWSARAIDDFDLGHFNEGDYLKSVESKVLSETLSRVLYPNDATEQGRELRLKQEYFFVSASIQDIIRRHLQHHPTLDDLPEKAAVQLNDTHPAIAIAELMHQLMDFHHHEWDAAWSIVQRVFAYTNHTLLPEALEAWPIRLMERLLPRHMQIIYDINARFLAHARAAGSDDGRLSRLSLIDEGGERRVRMGNLAFLGSHTVNGVSALHTGLMRSTVFADLDAVLPGRIVNQTNGITPRRWLMQANPGLTRLLERTVGTGFMTDLDRLADVRPFADDPEFRDRFRQVKRDNKHRLALLIARLTGIAVDTDSLFDVQIKRIHEYKRQLLNVLHTLALYNALRDGTAPPSTVPVTKIFGGKAAPSYRMAKLILKLINDVATLVNNDPVVRDRLRVVLLPNYNVTLAEAIIPAADLSEQISTAGMEASGTGNMKLALNGALTIGTLDGANVEIREAVGPENIFIFGLTAPEVRELRTKGYDPRAVIVANPSLRRILDMIAGGILSPDEPDRYRALVAALADHGDYFLVTADFAEYVDTHAQVHALYAEPHAWTSKAVRNTAAMGWFSSDRTVSSYARDIWGVRPLHGLAPLR